MNPFRCVGSYIGLAIGAVFSYLSFSAVLVLCEFGSCRWTAVLIPIMPIVLFFFLGWGVHEFIRWIHR